MPIRIPNLGSGRTKCEVYICRHNREAEMNKGNESDILNISSYVEKLSLATNIHGGGSGTLSLIPAFPWEDDIAANDIINVYLNTNRGDERSVYERDPKTGKSLDNTWRYNKGNVRVFFGYVDHVSKTTSMGGVGTRVTSYTLTFTSFDKAVKATQVYVNPNLAFQTDQTNSDPVRPDISNNLGGLILFQKGFKIAGSPRSLIISHLFRTLGFGAQWILPQAYTDDISKHNAPSPRLGNFNDYGFEPWGLTWTKEKRNKKDVEEFGRFPFFYKPKLQQILPGRLKDTGQFLQEKIPIASQGDPICYNTSFNYFDKDSFLGK